MSTRHPQDYYKTPEWCYEALQDLIDWERVRSFLEPCCGDGRIVRWVNKQEHVRIFQYGDIPQYDYFTHMYDSAHLCLTNPPYSLAEQFVRKSITDNQCTIMLLRLGFLASQGRYQLFKTYPITGLYVLSRRPSFINGRTDNSEYAWFAWDKTGEIAKKGIHHIL